MNTLGTGTKPNMGIREHEGKLGHWEHMGRKTNTDSQVKSSHLYLYSAFNNTDCVKALNSIKLEDRVSVMYNNKIKH